jgi:endonuclease-3 related protein
MRPSAPHRQTISLPPPLVVYCASGAARRRAGGAGDARGAADMTDPRFKKIYERLRRAYGPRRWWPVTPPGGAVPRYTGGPRSPRQRFEVAVGAVLTQNTAWTNASRAIERLNLLGAMSPRAISDMEERSLAEAIRPAGYYNQKAKRLKILAAYFLSRRTRSRASLLELNGVGPETADSIVLYAWNEPVFVIDAYTRRIFGRLGLIPESAGYEEARKTFEENLPRRASLYREYHALIVEHGKRSCRTVPACKKCLLKPDCASYLTGSGRTSTAKSG